MIRGAQHPSLGTRSCLNSVFGRPLCQAPRGCPTARRSDGAGRRRLRTPIDASSEHGFLVGSCIARDDRVSSWLSCAAELRSSPCAKSRLRAPASQHSHVILSPAAGHHSAEFYQRRRYSNAPRSPRWFAGPMRGLAIGVFGLAAPLARSATGCAARSRG